MTETAPTPQPELHAQGPLTAPSPLEGGELEGLLAADPRSDSVYRLAELCRYEPQHAQQVARLSLKLFDQLQDLHGLSPEDRYLLQTAALLHDIGWLEGYKAHHKTAMRIIQRTTLLPFGHNKRLVIGSVVRYHRKALPSLKHDHYKALSPRGRAVVKLLAGMLRLANALDISHGGVVTRLVVREQGKHGELVIYCGGARPGEEEWEAARKESKLLAASLKRKLSIAWLLEMPAAPGENAPAASPSVDSPSDSLSS